MRNKWKNQKKKYEPKNEPVKENLNNDPLPKIDPTQIKKVPIKKESFFNTITKDRMFPLIIGIFIFSAMVLSYTFYISIIDTRTPITIKLGYVDNYTNIVKDECGVMFFPVDPQLTYGVTADQKVNEKISIILNESDIYTAELPSSKLLRGAQQERTYITKFKLLEDTSKYIPKNCT